jgi:hypothetical protein
MKRFWNALGSLILIAIGSAMISIVLINWMIGCGETFYNADGSWETGSCFLIPYEPVRSQ